MILLTDLFVEYVRSSWTKGSSLVPLVSQTIVSIIENNKMDIVERVMLTDNADKKSFWEKYTANRGESWEISFDIIQIPNPALA